MWCICIYLDFEKEDFQRQDLELYFHPLQDGDQLKADVLNSHTYQNANVSILMQYYQLYPLKNLKICRR